MVNEIYQLLGLKPNWEIEGEGVGGFVCRLRNFADNKKVGKKICEVY
jgi:hypothetical protein